MTDIETAPDEGPVPVLTAYIVSRDGQDGCRYDGTEDLLEALEALSVDRLRVTPEFYADWLSSVNAASAKMDPDSIIAPTAADILSPSKY